MSCCDGCIKYLLFFTNLIFSLSGLALIVVGSLNISNTSSFANLVSDIESTVQIPQIFLIVVGVIIFFIATLGCCGAIKENRCMLITFAILLLSIFIIQLAIGIYTLTHKIDFKDKVQSGLRKEFSKIRDNPNIRKSFEIMAREFECCGVVSYVDYISEGMNIDGACCQDKSDCKIKPGLYWNRGCAEAVTNFTEQARETLGGVAIALSVIEVLEAIFALRLASKYR